jgi:predicted GNAT family acetyltransferase
LVVEAFMIRAPDNQGVTGTTAEARAFADEWVRLSGTQASIRMEMRIHQLQQVVPPRPTAGVARLADVEDRQRLIDWTKAFEAEADTGAPPDRDHGAAVDALLAEQGAWIWDADVRAVSYVGLRPPIAGVVRIGPVYTPPEQRGNGYASALVARASQHALDNGAAKCALYTDLANSTSNKIYAALGYESVVDVTAYTFT